ncbi:MAG TPA: alkaline phosphatase family protein, partial [Candidatus Acidoferrum sp.]|nr:alkaline phosphatase family protein [Candidatus Acidoferrum sp.]
PMSQLASDLNGETPQMSWITPGLCNDGHDCPIRTADNWLAQIVPLITGSIAWQQNGALFITWDEGNGADDQVALLAIAPGLRGDISMRLDHYSLLATIEDALGVARLNLAKQATSLNNQLQTKTIG